MPSQQMPFHVNSQPTTQAFDRGACNAVPLDYSHVTSQSSEHKRPRRKRGGECYNCGQDGHLSRDCPAPRNPKDLAEKRCYNCGQVGHQSQDCTESRKEEGVCFDFQKGECTRGAGCRFTHAQGVRQEHIDEGPWLAAPQWPFRCNPYKTPTPPVWPLHKWWQQGR